MLTINLADSVRNKQYNVSRNCVWSCLTLVTLSGITMPYIKKQSLIHQQAIVGWDACNRPLHCVHIHKHYIYKGAKGPFLDRKGIRKSLAIFERTGFFFSPLLFMIHWFIYIYGSKAAGREKSALNVPTSPSRKKSPCPNYPSYRLKSLSLIHIWRCRRIERCRSRWSPYH